MCFNALSLFLGFFHIIKLKINVFCNFDWIQKKKEASLNFLLFDFIFISCIKFKFERYNKKTLIEINFLYIFFQLPNLGMK